MNIQAFRMMLNPGCKDEYRRRHDALWPELKQALTAAGIRWYRIFLDPERDTLFALMIVDDQNTVDHLPELAIMQRWWTYMADLMPTHADQSPITVPLEEMFSLYPEVLPCK